jgi:hypothetical protein
MGTTRVFILASSFAYGIPTLEEILLSLKVVVSGAGIESEGPKPMIAANIQQCLISLLHIACHPNCTQYVCFRLWQCKNLLFPPSTQTPLPTASPLKEETATYCSSTLSRRGSIHSLSTTDDFHDLLSNTRLTGFVVLNIQGANQLLSVIRSGAHRRHPCS